MTILICSIKKYKKNPSEENKELYKNASKVSQRFKRQEILKKEQGILNSNDPNQFWKYVTSKLTYKSEIPCLLNLHNNLVTDNYEKAKLLNEYFQSVFTNDDQKKHNLENSRAPYHSQ